MWRLRTPLHEHIWIFCDGGLGMAEYEEPPPGLVLPLHAGCGAVARADDGAILDWAWRTLPAVTSVEAEYAGLLLGAEVARRLRPRTLCFVMDSAVVVGQMTGRYAVNSRTLRRWHARACEAIHPWPNVRFRHVPRAWNILADALGRQAGLPWDALRSQLEEEPPCPKPPPHP